MKRLFKALAITALAVTASFPGLETYGFNPSVTLEALRRWSDVALYDTERLGLTFGLVSAF